jgi:HAD superfamily hydrolase (TIGR01509 family)
MIDAAQPTDTHQAQRVLLFDADGTLFPSEEPAFEASVGVTNTMLRSLGFETSYTAEELRERCTGRTFRTAAAELARQHANADELAPQGPREQHRDVLDQVSLQRWVDEECRVVTEHLGAVLMPDPDVRNVLARLRERYEIAVVTSSARPRLDACLAVTGLSQLFPPHRRFSAESSLVRPTSKPDPAIYFHALDQLDVGPHQAIAIEDSAIGARAALAAGITTIGQLAYTPHVERGTRRAELARLGVAHITTTWTAIPTTVEACWATPAQIGPSRRSD